MYKRGRGDDEGVGGTRYNTKTNTCSIYGSLVATRARIFKSNAAEVIKLLYLIIHNAMKKLEKKIEHFLQTKSCVYLFQITSIENKDI